MLHVAQGFTRVAEAESINNPCYYCAASHDHSTQNFAELVENDFRQVQPFGWGKDVLKNLDSFTY